mgnify:CR=1 FL=1
MNKPKLFLIDAYALILRGYYAFIKNPRINSKGFDTSAIMGFLNSIFDILNRENPDYFSVVFDKGGSKDRREIFQECRGRESVHIDAMTRKGRVTSNELSSMPNYPLGSVHLENDVPAILSKMATASRKMISAHQCLLHEIEFLGKIPCEAEQYLSLIHI